MKYYPISKNWKRIKAVIETKEVQKVLVENFNKYTQGRWGEPFKPGMKPHDFESCDWWCDRKGKMPEYWNYVKHAACHWLVNLNLKVAMLVEPKKEWQIVTSQKHSTVWDGNDTLFDFNFSALGVDPQEAFDMAYEGKLLEIGKSLRVYFAEHWKIEHEQYQKQNKNK